jgi:predicted Zn-dependent protease
VILELARRVAEGSPADETEVTVDAAAERFVRFADRGPTQSADRERVDVSIRARLSSPGGVREARATCCGTDEAAFDAAVERAVALARVSPPAPDQPPLGGPVEVPETRSDAATLAHPFEQKAEWVRDALAACKSADLRPAGLCGTGGLARAIVNTAGREVFGYRTRAHFALTASAPGGGAGLGEQVVARAGNLDVARAIHRAVEKGAANRTPADLEPGEYTVVLEPSAVSSILLFASYQGLGAREVDEQSSFLCGRMGQRCFAEGVTLLDDATNAEHPDLPFDAEGTPKAPLVLVDRGTPTRPVTDRAWAARRGEESTGHALAQPSEHGPMARNLALAAGDQSLEELIAGVERGLLVTQLHYTNMIEPRELTLTGMPRNGTFLIENGRISKAVKSLRFTQTLVDALARVSGVGSEREAAGALFGGELLVPALRVERFRFTSSSDL